MKVHEFEQPTTKPLRIKHLTPVVKAGTIVRLQDGSLIMRTTKPPKQAYAWICIWARSERFIGCAFSEYEMRIDRIVNHVLIDSAPNLKQLGVAQ